MKARMAAMVFGFLMTLPTHAAVIVTPEITGTFSYNYTIENTDPLGIIFFQLTLPTAPTSVSSPNSDWIANVSASGTNTLVQWASDVSQVPPGGNLSGFVVVSPFGAVSVPYETLDTQLNSASGMVSGPGDRTSTIPEPGTFAVAGLSLAALFLEQRYSRRS